MFSPKILLETGEFSRTTFSSDAFLWEASVLDKLVMISYETGFNSENNTGSSKTSCWCFFSPLPQKKSFLLMKFQPWSCETPLCGSSAETCSQFRRLQCICKFVFAAGWVAKPPCGCGNSSTQVKKDPGGFPVSVLIAQARKLFQMVVSCTALLRSHHLAGARAGAATRAVWQLCLGKGVWRKETFMKMSRLFPQAFIVKGFSVTGRRGNVVHMS